MCSRGCSGENLFTPRRVIPASASTKKQKNPSRLNVLRQLSDEQSGCDALKNANVKCLCGLCAVVFCRLLPSAFLFTCFYFFSLRTYYGNPLSTTLRNHRDGSLHIYYFKELNFPCQLYSIQKAENLPARH